MKREEFVALGLTEDQAKACEKASQKELETYVPKTQLDQVTAEKTALETSVKDHKTQLETLEKSKGNLEELKLEIQTLQADNKAKEEAHTQEIHQIKVDSAVTAAIHTAGGKNAKAIQALLELGNAQLAQDGTVIGLAEQMKKLQGAEDSKFLFSDPKAQPTLKGANPAQSGDTQPQGMTKEAFRKLPQVERLAFAQSNPDAYGQLYQGGTN